MKTALCLLFLTTVGCFDVEQVDPCAAAGPFLVDDFEGADELPAPPFGQWSCRGFNPDDAPEAVTECTFTTGQDGQGFMGDFALQDVRNMMQEFTGGALRTSSTRALDLSCHRELLLSARFEAGPMPPPAGSTFNAELTCQSAKAGGVVGGTSGTAFSILRILSLTSSWQSFRVPLSSFTQPSWQTERIDGNERGCLPLVDGVGLQLSTTLADGESGGGKLFIDNVSFE